MRRAPGFCVNPVSGEPTLLWTEEKTLDICAHHWRHFASRYKGIPNRRLSFNLLNEPYGTTEGQYVKVVRRLTQEIREVDPNRLIIADALDGKPVRGLKVMKIVQSTRGYTPGDWMRDCLSLWKEVGWGWALWCMPTSRTLSIRTVLVLFRTRL